MLNTPCANGVSWRSLKPSSRMLNIAEPVRVLNPSTVPDMVLQKRILPGVLDVWAAATGVVRAVMTRARSENLTLFFMGMLRLFLRCAATPEKNAKWFRRGGREWTQ